MTIGRRLRKLINHVGLDVSRYRPQPPPHLARRGRILRMHGVDTVLDVGANAGNFALELRSPDVGYTGRIISFEPMSEAYERLEVNAAEDARWEVHRCALGSHDGEVEINIAGNSYSSSILDMLPAHLDAAPESLYVGRETIKVRPLDSIFPEVKAGGESFYLKIDTQGFEMEVLQGARDSLRYIDTVQLEMSLVPMYAGETGFVEMCAYMKEQEYDLIALEDAFSDPTTGHLLQADGVFHRRGLPREERSA